ncbi:hypothetical protein NDU88_000368 [Pleurodeles waltl]|uniref:Uncharacterized protein n=1 Tax=Pleurodeles waltl TaxID=8319 RepID=A0AAV7VT99_PLEWA|nr:hypothetical protein NDU88_000368 [Pleurodeles waltl]
MLLGCSSWLPREDPAEEGAWQHSGGVLEYATPRGNLPRAHRLLSFLFSCPGGTSDAQFRCTRDSTADGKAEERF